MTEKHDVDRQSFDTIIEPHGANQRYWRDVWAYRELFAFLAWRDLLVRYKQTVVGVLWSVLRPLISMVVFTFIFGHVAKLPSEGGAPYAVMVMAALLPWQAFANTLLAANTSLVGNRNLISKIYFPRIILPASGLLVSCADFLIAFVILVGVMAWYGMAPTPRLLLVPILLLVALSAALALGLFLSALNIRYRDFTILSPFIVQLGLFISPVAYSSAVVDEAWRWLYSLNPMVGVIDGFRWVVIGGDVDVYMPGIVLSLGLILVLLVFGIWFFRGAEREFADVV